MRYTKLNFTIMAKESVKILKGKLDVDNLLVQLNAALSEEWLAYYQYWIGAFVAEGAMRANVQAEFEEHAQEELGHAKLLADRIIKMHISPINISVHTTNPQLRVRMLANKRGGEVLKYLPRLVEGGIAVNCQLVLCRGINDGEELRRTLGDLLELTPMVQSIAAVPCGVTDYRQNLFKQTPYDAETSAAVIDIMEEFGDECKRRHGKRIIYPSDEWYLKAGRPIPPAEFYEDFDQLENGVGMMRLFEDEFRAELDRPHRIYGTKQIDVVTGTMAGPLITELMDELHRQYPMIDVKVHVVKNNFFGGNVGVAGLVTATDIIAQCEGKLKSGTLGIPAVMLREEKDTFLDDMTIAQLGERLGVKVEVLPVGGGDEAKALLRTGLHISRRRRA